MQKRFTLTDDHVCSTPMGDQDRISLYNTKTILSREVMRIDIKEGIISQSNAKILPTSPIRILLQTIKRITNEIIASERVSIHIWWKYINLLTRGPTQTLMLKLKFINLVVTGHLLMAVIYKW